MYDERHFRWFALLHTNYTYISLNITLAIVSLAISIFDINRMVKSYAIDFFMILRAPSEILAELAEPIGNEITTFCCWIYFLTSVVQIVEFLHTFWPHVNKKRVQKLFLYQMIKAKSTKVQSKKAQNSTKKKSSQNF